MRYGTVIRYFPEKGFGFIQPDTGPEIFFHISAIGACQAEPEIKPGQAVKYELAARKRASEDEDSAGSRPRESKTGQPARREAKLVELIDKIPGATLAEDNSKDQADRHPKSRRKKPTWRR